MISSLRGTISHMEDDWAVVEIGGVGLQALFLMTTYACTHQWKAVGGSFVVVVSAACALYFTWYKHLPDKDEGKEVTPAI